MPSQRHQWPSARTREWHSRASRDTCSVESLVIPEEHLGGGYGIATLDDGERVPCGSYCWIGYVDDRDEKTDLLILELPANGLAAVWPAVGEFPFVEPEGVQAWPEPLEEWLADIGRSVFRMCSFRTPASGSKSRRPIRKSGCVRPTCRPRESAGSAFCDESSTSSPGTRRPSGEAPSARRGTASST